MTIVILNESTIYWPRMYSRMLIARRLRVLASIPLAIQIPSAALSGISEELLARGYAIERLTTLSGSVLFAGIIGTILDVASHVPFWGIWYAVTVTPGEILLAWVYVRSRRLLPCVIAHVLLDVVPTLKLHAR